MTRTNLSARTRLLHNIINRRKINFQSNNINNKAYETRLEVIRLGSTPTTPVGSITGSSGDIVLLTIPA